MENGKRTTSLRDKYINICYHNDYSLIILLENDKAGCLGVDEKQETSSLQHFREKDPTVT